MVDALLHFLNIFLGNILGKKKLKNLICQKKQSS